MLCSCSDIKNFVEFDDLAVPLLRQLVELFHCGSPGSIPAENWATPSCSKKICEEIIPYFPLIRHGLRWKWKDHGDARTEGDLQAGTQHVSSLFSKQQKWAKINLK
jgi:hypothetical protein